MFSWCCARAVTALRRLKCTADEAVFACAGALQRPTPSLCVPPRLPPLPVSRTMYACAQCRLNSLLSADTLSSSLPMPCSSSRPHTLAGCRSTACAWPSTRLRRSVWPTLRRYVCHRCSWHPPLTRALQALQRAAAADDRAQQAREIEVCERAHEQGGVLLSGKLLSAAIVCGAASSVCGG